MPQIGAVLVPINFRLTAEESPTSWSTAAPASSARYADGIERSTPFARGSSALERVVAFEGARPEGWLRLRDGDRSGAGPDFERPPIAALRARSLISINYTSGTTARPKGVMITHRNA